MIQFLPYGGLKWLSKNESNDFCLSATPLNSVSENISIGYILEVELEYPDEFHDLYNNYPLTPDKLEISQNMSSKYCSTIANEYGIRVGGVNKLVPNLRNNNKYVFYYSNLQLYLSLGMKLTKVHRFKSS